MTTEQWSLLFEAVTAIATLAVPLVVAYMANRFNDQLKMWEASQWRNQELIKARLEYYRELVPQLNDLMTYVTFIGPWKEFTPPQVVQMKRALDRAFYCAAPLFSEEVARAYQVFMAECFEMFGPFGTDARIRSGYARRKEAVGTGWDDGWNSMFTVQGGQPIPPETLTATRDRYNALITAFANDIELHSARDRYVNVEGHQGAA